VAASGPAIHLLSVRGGQVFDTIADAHPGGGIRLSFCESGTRFVSGGADGRLRVWRSAPQEDAGRV